MFTDANRKELDDHGLTVVPGVLSEEECDRHKAFFRQWLDSFPEGKFPQSRNSLIQRYKSGHMKPAWEVRLAAKQVFSQLWGTEKLLTSMDAIAIGRPPEEGQEEFWSPKQCWLHVDQAADRKGLHGYQGAVYLEDCEEEDWTFEVVKDSHKHFDQVKSHKRFNKLKPRTLKLLEKKGCERIRVPCPKGGIILWDSRLIHANARPVQGRSHPDRWRYVVFVCMTPARWASPADLEMKRKAYRNLLLTNHWPSRGVFTFPVSIGKSQVKDPNPLEVLPEVARSKDAQQLAGILAYDEDEGNTEPDYVPEWEEEEEGASGEKPPSRGTKRTIDSRKWSRKM